MAEERERKCPLGAMVAIGGGPQYRIQILGTMREKNGDCTYKFSAFSYWLGAKAGMKEPYLSVFPFISSFHFALKCSICSPFRKLSFHISGTYLSFSYMLHLVVSVVALSCWRNIIFCDRCKLGILVT